MNNYNYKTSIKDFQMRAPCPQELAATGLTVEEQLKWWNSRCVEAEYLVDEMRKYKQQISRDEAERHNIVAGRTIVRSLYTEEEFLVTEVRQITYLGGPPRFYAKGRKIHKAKLRKTEYTLTIQSHANQGVEHQFVRMLLEPHPEL